MLHAKRGIWCRVLAQWIIPKSVLGRVGQDARAGAQAGHHRGHLDLRDRPDAEDLGAREVYPA